MSFSTDTVAVVSGGTISVSGTVSVLSGGTIPVSNLSGFTPTIFRTSGLIQLSDSSGGVGLASGPIVSMVIKNRSGNAPIYVGSNTNRPFSGLGLELTGGEAIGFDLDNFGKIFLLATTSGQFISYAGVQ